MDLSAFPILREDDSSLDWEQASYFVDGVTVLDASVRGKHRLEQAPQLEALITAGVARWAVEVRCPTTLLARVDFCDALDWRCQWDQDAVEGDVFVVPGLISVKPLELDADGLIDLWGREPITVPPGRWLVRGMVRKISSLAGSLLTFSQRTNLPDGVMEVSPDRGSGDIRFNVFLAPNIFPRRVDRDIQVAALIAALGRIPHIDEADEEGGDSRYPILRQIRQRLEDCNVPAWGGDLDASYDPARAATAIEPFQLISEESESS